MTVHHGLTDQDRIVARRKMMRSALLAYNHAPSIHYTQGPRRWSGIDQKKRSYKGQYPYYADCSAFVTWIYWDALKKHINHGFPDILNGARWQAGFTGTLLNHGRPVKGKPTLIGDLVIYGTPGSTGKHVAMYIGNGKVISHGSEGGPYILPWNYRSDVQSVRRYL